MKRLNKHSTSLFSLLLLLCIALSSLVVNAAPNKETINYNRESAIEYAKQNWYSTVSNHCACFVSACLQAGGIPIDETNVRGLYNAVIDITDNKWYSLTTEETSWGLTVKKSDNPDLHEGDILLSYCPRCNLFLHAALMGGTDADGYVSVYAHSMPKNNERFYADHWHDISNLKVYSIMLPTQSSPAIYQAEVQMSNIKIPSNICIKQGEGISLSGEINIYNLDTSYPVIGYILDSQGTTLQYNELQTQEFVDLASFNNGLDFSILEPGNYEFVMTLSSSPTPQFMPGEARELLRSNFEVVRVETEQDSYAKNNNLIFDVTCYPTGELSFGQPYGIRGTISSLYQLAYVYAELRCVDTDTVYHQIEHHPYVKTIDLKHEINEAMIFNDLPHGQYNFTLEAKNSTGYSDNISFVFYIV